MVHISIQLRSHDIPALLGSALLFWRSRVAVRLPSLRGRTKQLECARTPSNWSGWLPDLTFE